MKHLTLENAKTVIDKATSTVLATRAEHALFSLALDTIYDMAKESEALKIENESLKEKIK